MNKKETLHKIDKITRSFCYQLLSFHSEFESEFIIRNDNDKEFYESIDKLIKTIQNDAYFSVDLIAEILNTENDYQFNKEVML